MGKTGKFSGIFISARSVKKSRPIISDGKTLPSLSFTNIEVACLITWSLVAKYPPGKIATAVASGSIKFFLELGHSGRILTIEFKTCGGNLSANPGVDIKVHELKIIRPMSQ